MQQVQAALRNDQQRLEQQAAAARHQAQRDQASATERERIGRLDLDRQEKEANDRYVSQRADLESQINEAVRYLNTKRSVLARAQQRSDVYAAITFKRYVKFVAIGKG